MSALLLKFCFVKNWGYYFKIKFIWKELLLTIDIICTFSEIFLKTVEVCLDISRESKIPRRSDIKLSFCSDLKYLFHQNHWHYFFFHSFSISSLLFLHHLRIITGQSFNSIFFWYLWPLPLIYLAVLFKKNSLVLFTYTMQ